MLSEFWLYVAGVLGWLSESVKKKFVTKIFFQTMLNEALKKKFLKNDICWCKSGNLKKQAYIK